MEQADVSQLRQAAVEGRPRRAQTEADLKFTRQPMVRWFSPKVLLSSAQRLVVSTAFGGFLDKRELQQAVVGRGAGGEGER